MTMPRSDLVIAVGLALLCFGLGTLHGASSADVREWRSSAGLAVRAGKPFRDSLAVLRQREARLLGAMRQARHAAESLLASVPRESIPPSLLLVLGEQTRALDACEAGVATCQMRAVMAEGRADSLEAQLRKGLYLTKCKILMLPCPSRGLVFVGGVLSGVLVSGVVP